MRESGLIRHLCKLKKRYLERDRQDVRFGYIAYRIFYEISYPTRRLDISTDHFRKSSVYDAFVKFGKYVVETNAISPEEFIRYAIQSKRSIDNWCDDRLYMEYVRNLNKVEDSMRAIERTIKLAESWAVKEGKEIKNLFREIATPLAVRWLISGRISPWAIFNSESGRELWNRFSNEQYDMLQKAIDMSFWKKKFLSAPEECQRIEHLLTIEGI